MNKNEICAAINNRKLLSFNYENLSRIVEPFTLGNSRKDNMILSAYQIDGGAHRDTVPCWGLFNLDKISNLEVLSESFSANREEYRRDDSRMHHIYCQI